VSTTIEFTILDSDRDAALAVVRGALRGRGHRIEDGPRGTFTASRGSRLLTILFGALVPPGHRWRRYTFDVRSHAGSTRLVLAPAAHRTAVAGGPAAEADRRTAWNLIVDGVESALSVAGMLVHRSDPIAEPV
jgi:hypothetical protein